MKFGDLGNAIRKCRSDFGVEITIDPSPVKVSGAHGLARAHGVMGTIHNPKLPGMDAEDGNMLYIKPTITENVPRDVLAYREPRPVFPDQSTADQWFDESQFESYRRLGAYSFEFLTGTTGASTEKRSFAVPEFFDLVKRQLASRASPSLTR